MRVETLQVGSRIESIERTNHDAAHITIEPRSLSVGRLRRLSRLMVLEDLSEKIDLVLPEVTARVAALEHLLREKQLVTRQDLISARAFVRLQEE